MLCRALNVCGWVSAWQQVDGAHQHLATHLRRRVTPNHWQMSVHKRAKWRNNYSVDWRVFSTGGDAEQRNDRGGGGSEKRKIPEAVGRSVDRRARAERDGSDRMSRRKKRLLSHHVRPICQERCVIYESYLFPGLEGNRKIWILERDSAFVYRTNPGSDKRLISLRRLSIMTSHARVRTNAVQFDHVALTFRTCSKCWNIASHK